MANVLILGANGMLGNELLSQFIKSNHTFMATTRNGEVVHDYQTVKFEVGRDDVGELIRSVDDFDYVFNCIGLINQKFSKLNYGQIEKINTDFPRLLQESISGTEAKLIQIATDCVFDGAKGNYSENSIKSPSDKYALSKLQGEIFANNVMNLRCSIVGHELKSNYSLLSWFLSLPQESEIEGYQNAIWNGVTTTGFFEYVNSIINNGFFTPGTFHVLPKNFVSKYELLCLFREVFGRNDIKINPVTLANQVNRRLVTNYIEQNEAIWSQTAYYYVPDIEELVLDPRFVRDYEVG